MQGAPDNKNATTEDLNIHQDLSETHLHHQMAGEDQDLRHVEISKTKQ